MLMSILPMYIISYFILNTNISALSVSVSVSLKWTVQIMQAKIMELNTASD